LGSMSSPHRYLYSFPTRRSSDLIVSAGIYIVIFFSAPFIAKFYDQLILQDILRVYALSFVIRSLVAVHVAKLTKEMNFKTQMKRSEEHTSELQSRENLVCRLLLE